MLGLALALCRADSDTEAAAGAIFRSNLQRVLQLGELAPLGNRSLEAFGRVIECAVVNLGANDRVRANHDALAALDTKLLIPHRNFEGDVALLPLGRSRRKGAIDRHGANGNLVAIAGDHQGFHVANKIGGVDRDCRTNIEGRSNRLRNLHFMQILQGRIDGGEVLADNRLAALAIGLLDSVFDGGDGFFTRQNAADGEEAGLHNRIDAAAHASLARNIDGVDHVEAELLFEDGFLRGARQIVPNFFRAERAVEQEDRARVSGFRTSSRSMKLN